MKILYKIFESALEEKAPESVAAGYMNVRPIKHPDFENEKEAESWLKTETEKTEPLVDNKFELRSYLFIQKTYII